jgi:hypothetical protein
MEANDQAIPPGIPFTCIYCSFHSPPTSRVRFDGTSFTMLQMDSIVVSDIYFNA